MTTKCNVTSWIVTGTEEHTWKNWWNLNKSCSLVSFKSHVMSIPRLDRRLWLLSCLHLLCGSSCSLLWWSKFHDVSSPGEAHITRNWRWPLVKSQGVTEALGPTSLEKLSPTNSHTIIIWLHLEADSSLCGPWDDCSQADALIPALWDPEP